MSIGYKVIFFANLAISLLLVLSLWLLSIEYWLHPFKKNSESIILLSGGIILSIGMYFSVRFGYKLDSLSSGLFWLFGTWLATMLFITIGLIFFNGPQK